MYKELLAYAANRNSNPSELRMNFPIPQRHDQVIDTYLCLNSEVRKNFGLSQLDKDKNLQRYAIFLIKQLLLGLRLHHNLFIDVF